MGLSQRRRLAFWLLRKIFAQEFFRESRVAPRAQQSLSGGKIWSQVVRNLRFSALQQRREVIGPAKPGVGLRQQRIAAHSRGIHRNGPRSKRRGQPVIQESLAEIELCASDQSIVRVRT